jgi:hypothetical protein
LIDLSSRVNLYTDMESKLGVSSRKFGKACVNLTPKTIGNADKNTHCGQFVADASSLAARRWWANPDAVLQPEAVALGRQGVRQFPKITACMTTTIALVGGAFEPAIVHRAVRAATWTDEIRQDLHAKPNSGLPVTGWIELQDPRAHTFDPTRDGHLLYLKNSGCIVDWPLL